MQTNAQTEDELLALLTSWDLERLFDTLKGFRFTIKDVLALAKDDLPTITQFKGEQDRLWERIEEARSKRSSEVASGSQPTHSSSTATDLTEPGPSSKAKRKGTTGAENAAKKKMCVFDSSRYAEQFDVVAVLRKTRRGQNILDSYNDPTVERPLLSERQRNVMVTLIVTDIRDSVDRFQHQYLQSISEKIQIGFPAEDPKTYYRAPHTEGNDTSAPQGKLPSKLRNIPTQEGGQGQLKSKSTSTASVNTANNFQTLCAEPVTDEVLGAKTWLKVTNSPWVEVLIKWRLTAPIRFKFLFEAGDDDYVNTYINEWQILKHNSGYELLLADFKLLYPDAAESLYIKWESFIRRNIEVARKDVKDQKGKEILRELEKENLSPNSQAVLLLALLPSIRTNQRPVINGKQVKVSEADCRESYLLHVTNANDLLNAVRQRRNKFSQDGQPGGQPLICAIGPSLCEVRSIHVNVANLDWVATSGISALDICFKSFFALHTEYPKASEHVWSTIQRAVYNVKSSSDSKIKFCHSWIRALT